MRRAHVVGPAFRSRPLTVTEVKHEASGVGDEFLGSGLHGCSSRKFPRKNEMGREGRRLRREGFQIPVGGNDGGTEVALPDAGGAATRCARASDERGFDSAWDGRIGRAVFVAAICE